jgi:hypothetical protein
VVVSRKSGKIPVPKSFIKALGREIIDPYLQKKAAHSALPQFPVHFVHESSADSMSAGFGNNVQCNDVSKIVPFDASQDISKNPAGPFRHPCYAFRVVQIGCNLVLGKCNVLGKADLIDVMQYIGVTRLELANLYWRFGHRTIILPAPPGPKHR